MFVVCALLFSVVVVVAVVVVDVVAAVVVVIVAGCAVRFVVRCVLFDACPLFLVWC